MPDAPISVLERCVVAGRRCRVDGRRTKVIRGHWAFFLPELGCKVLNAVGGHLHCTHGTAPSRDALAAGSAQIVDLRYTAEDWRRAYATPAARRAAENYVAAARLAAHGLGPAVKGCVAVRSLSLDGGETVSAGIIVDDLARYAKKRETTETEMLAAGVVPDRIRSSLRQQIRGYVSDLNSVVPVRSVEAEAEVTALAARIEDALSR